MTTQEAIDCLQELSTQLWNSQDRFTDGDVQAIIQAIDDHAIPVLKERAMMEKIADKFVEIGNPGEIFTKEELERIMDISQQIYDEVMK